METVDNTANHQTFVRLSLALDNEALGALQKFIVKSLFGHASGNYLLGQIAQFVGNNVEPSSSRCSKVDPISKECTWA